MKRRAVIFILGMGLSFEGSAIPSCFIAREKSPSPVSEYERLKREGYRESYIAGMDEVMNFLKFTQETLRGGGVDSQRSHLEYFDALIDTHFDYMERGIRQQWRGDGVSMTRRLEKLADLKAQAQERQREQKVTYAFWIDLNNRLVQIASRDMREHQGNDSLQILENWTTALLDRFPDVILMPLIDGIIGYIPMNRAVAQRVYPLAVVSDVRKIDGVQEDPLGTLLHDFPHLFLIEKNLFSEGATSLHGELLRKINVLPKKKREMAEFVYYVLSHEVATPVVPVLRRVLDYPLSRLYPYNTIGTHAISTASMSSDRTPYWVNQRSKQSVISFVEESIRVYDGLVQEVVAR